MAIRTRKVSKYLVLKQLRTRFGITQETAGRLLGCSVGNYNGKENGRYNWTLQECFILQTYINKKLVSCGEEKMSIDDIFLATECQIWNKKKGWLNERIASNRPKRNIRKRI